jgi:hypothetical protein
VLDREQGGLKNLENSGIRLHSVLRVSQILNYLEDAGQISAEQHEEIREALLHPKKPAKNGSTSHEWALSTRSAELSKHPLNMRLLEIMHAKKTNLCVAVDLPDADKVLEVTAILKEVLYRSLFRLSNRSKNTSVPLNCMRIV